jgi:uncharacterized protein with HEPN domain
MSRDLAYIFDILEAAKLIKSYVEGIDKIAFDKDVMRQDAIFRRITIIGEATKRLSEEFRVNHPEISWKQMAGMRDVIVHDYGEVDLDVIWDTATKSIPALIAQIEPLAPTEATPPDE